LERILAYEEELLCLHLQNEPSEWYFLNHCSFQKLKPIINNEFTYLINILILFSRVGSTPIFPSNLIGRVLMLNYLLSLSK